MYSNTYAHREIFSENNIAELHSDSFPSYTLSPLRILIFHFSLSCVSSSHSSTFYSFPPRFISRFVGRVVLLLLFIECSNERRPKLLNDWTCTKFFPSLYTVPSSSSSSSSRTTTKHWLENDEQAEEACERARERGSSDVEGKRDSVSVFMTF